MREGEKPSAKKTTGATDAEMKKEIFEEQAIDDRKLTAEIIDVIENETGIKVYHFSHMTHGEYDPGMVENEMRHNIEALTEAIQFAVKEAD